MQRLRTAGGLAVCATASYFADRFQNRPIWERREFFMQSTDEALEESLNTGDVLIINRTVFQPDPIKALIVMLSKYLNKSDFDHVGIIVKDRDDGYPYVLEYHFGQCKLTPYDERLLFARDRGDDEIFLRRLMVNEEKSKAMEAKRIQLEEWCETLSEQPEVHAMPSKTVNLFNLITAMWNWRAPVNNSRINSLWQITTEDETIQDCLGKMKSIEKENKSNKMKTAADNKRSRTRLERLVTQLVRAQTRRQGNVEEYIAAQVPWSDGSVADPTSRFCQVSPSSELVVKALQKLGHLPSLKQPIAAQSRVSDAIDIDISNIDSSDDWLPCPHETEYLSSDFLTDQGVPALPFTYLDPEAVLLQKHRKLKYVLVE